MRQERRSFPLQSAPRDTLAGASQGPRRNLPTPQPVMGHHQPGRSRSRFTRHFTLTGWVAMLIGLGLLDALAAWAAVVLVQDHSWWLMTALLGSTVVLNVVFIYRPAYPLRYLVPGLIFMAAMVVYPIVYTVNVAFTNYGTGHVLSKKQAVQQLLSQTYVPANGLSLNAQLFKDPAAPWSLTNLRILLTTPTGQQLLLVGQNVRPYTPAVAQTLPLQKDASGEATALGGYARLSMLDLIGHLAELQHITFTYNNRQYQMSDLGVFSPLARRYQYDPHGDTLTDQLTGVVYRPVNGTFTSSAGQELSPGFRAGVGWGNFARLVHNPQVAGPFAQVFVWTFVWALLSVLSTFVVGLGLALLLNDPHLRARTLYRVLLVVPYAMPGFISAMVWRGFYTPEVGLFTQWLRHFGLVIPWLTDPFWAKVAVLIVNLWMGFPYMMLITLGALQSIPNEMLDAARVDGASRWQQFRWITLPLLLTTVAPLLVSSFAFNFNNFNLIYLVTQGRPAIPNAQTPAGATDILISYTYRLAFESGSGTDYGLASAVAILIFLIIGTISWFNFRLTRTFEEVSQNA